MGKQITMRHAPMHFSIPLLAVAAALLVGGTNGLMTQRVRAAEPAADFPPIDKLPAVKELPDPLKMFDGTPVTTVEQWNTRKPELKAAVFEHYMYGPMPAAGTDGRAC